MSATIRQRDIIVLNLAFGVGVCAASWLLLSPHFALSLALGVALELANFHALFRFASRALLAGGVAVSSGFALRFVLLAAALWLALHLGAHPVGLVVGLSLVVPAVLLAAWRARPKLQAAATESDDDDDDVWRDWNPWLARPRELREDEGA